MNEQRRAPRKRPHYIVNVTDLITGQTLGQLGNLSSNGMLLISPHTPRSEAVYQVSLSLPTHEASMPTIEVGIQEQWHEPAATPGQIWSGFRIIAIGNNDAALLERWLQQA
ncbi:MAG TPA: PilZ domain-containing protein [Dyella sp.]|uniref:PilZ domain-containing protein n=1 Tax=Dyella sp. TaxID=1869338 RepID=UPI002BA8B514|nr:PilZ domain-containing protein [Dyella sp.]HUB90211.1 PilZ domain-containing protein [Dyella sp.]